MKARFIGDPNEAKPEIPEELSAFGLTFPKGKFIEVPPAVAAKLVGNNHFETEGAPPKVKEVAPTIAPIVLPEDPTVER